MTLPYLPAIDGLRALAVLAVLIFHLDPAFLPGGFAGVDVFFVISGYVVARSLAGREGERVGAFLAGFYARRVRRILPALVVCLLLSSLLTVWLVPESWLSSTTHRVGLAAFFGLSNLALVLHQDDYFSPRTDFNPFTHTWSLGVEEQFYFIFPLLFLIWLHWRAHQQGRWVASALLPGLALVSLGVAYLWGQQRPDWAYYLLPARFWELALGVLLFQWQQGGLRLPPAMQRIILPLGLMLIAAGYLWSDPQAFPYPWALLPVSGSLLLLWGISQGGSGWVLQALQQPVLRYVGRLSYSLYLWHWPVYVLLRWTLGLETWGQMGLAVLLTGLLAVASYHWIEVPVRQAKSLRPTRRALITGGCAVLLAWGGALQLFQHRDQITLSQTGNQWLWYAYAYPDHEPPQARAPMLNGQQLFVIGNSHTGAYATLVSLIEQRHGMQTHLWQTGHCALGNMLYPIAPLAGCATTAEHYLARLQQQARPGDVVFLASLRTHRLSDQWYRSDPAAVLAYSYSEQASQAIEAAYNETAALIEQLQALGLIVLFDAPKPVLRGPTYRCADAFNRHNPVCQGGLAVEENLMHQLRAPVVHSLHRLQNHFDDVYLWDPLPLLCHDGVCDAYDPQGLPLFFDGDHLSGHGNRVLYASFEQQLLQIQAECTLCQEERTRRAEQIAHLPPLAAQMPLTFTEQSTGVAYLLDGWSHPESWGTWSQGQQAQISLPLASAEINHLTLDLQPLVGGRLRAQPVHLRINGVALESHQLHEATRITITLPEIIRQQLQTTPLLQLELHLPKAISPTELGLGYDPRRLAVGITRLEVLE